MTALHHAGTCLVLLASVALGFLPAASHAQAKPQNLRSVLPGEPTLLPAVISPPACRPAYGVSLAWRWEAKPLDNDCAVFVHVSSRDGKTWFQADHKPPVATSRWTGRVEYETTMIVPTNAPPGEYRIVAGLYAPKGGARQKLKAGPGVKEIGKNGFQIGTFQITPDAPLPKLGPPTLDLKGYHLTFEEDFKEEPLSVSPHGPGTRWIAHTPYGGDFGDARFADPSPGFPFTLHDGILRIEAGKKDGRWQAGLLSSVDRQGNGFSQKYGYFEMRAKLPKGEGVWPAFWLLGVPKLKDKSATQIEIDVLEQYGVHPNALHTTVHLWYPDKRHTIDSKVFIVTGMTDDFHSYGVDVAEDFMTFYFDGVVLRRVKTPEEAKVPVYLLVNLALGSGWPIDKTPDPSYMDVDYVKAWSK